MCRKPVGMARLADHAALEAAPERSKERPHPFRVESQTRRQLQQHRTELVAESGRLREKRIKGRTCARQAEPVRYLMRRLDGKGKAIRYRSRPALVSRSPMGPVE